MARRRGRVLAAVCAAGLGVVVLAATPFGPTPVTSEAVDLVAVAPDDAGAAAGLDGTLAGPVVLHRSAQLPTAQLPTAQAASVVDPRASWGPSAQVLDDAAAAAAAMSLEQLAGQVIVARYNGADPGQAGAMVTNWHLGGVILADDNITTVDQVRASTAVFHAAVAADGRTWPAVVGVDEEGGRVSRLRGILADLPAFATFGAAGDDAATRDRFTRLGSDLAGLGFTMDFAPVADVTIGAADPTIGDRSASSDPVVAARTARAAAAGLIAGGVVPVIKHFPGHGSVTVDSHVGLPVQPASVDQLEARDLVPFTVAVDAGVPAVMIGHLDVTALEPGVPASLSAATYRLLRDDLGFEGVAVTDALNMAAVPESTPGEAAVRALAAGADLLLMPRDAGAAVTAIVAAVQDGRVPVERLREAATRVVALQMWTAELRSQT